MAGKGEGKAGGASPWVRVIEAGFGATVERHGFERISERCFRLEGDGLRWEVMLYRGVPDVPLSLRDYTGAFIPGFDELMERAFDPPERDTSGVTGGRRYHWATTIGDRYNDEVADNWPPRKERRWWHLFKSERESEGPVWLQDALAYFHYARYVDYVWSLSDADIDTVAEKMSSLWDRLVAPWVRQRMSLEGLIDSRLDKKPEQESNVHVDLVVLNKMAGRDSWVRDHLAYVDSLSRLNKKEALAAMRKHFPSSLGKKSVDRRPTDEKLDAWKPTRIDQGRVARQAAKALGIRLPN